VRIPFLSANVLGMSVARRRIVYFVTPVFSSVATGPALYAKYLWHAFCGEEYNFEFRLITLNSDVEHPKVHSLDWRGGGFAGSAYRKLEEFAAQIIEEGSGGSCAIIHSNISHAVDLGRFVGLTKVVQVNDTETCEWRWWDFIFGQASFRRNISLCWRKLRERRALFSADQVICNSDFCKNAVIRCYCIEPRRLLRVYKGIDLNCFSGIQSGQDLGEDYWRLVFVGSNWDIKGVDTLLRAMCILARGGKSRNYRLSIFGDPGAGARRKYLKLIESLGLGSIVDLPGRISRDELPLELKRCDIFVLPSRKEALGVSAIEALAAGIPVVAARVGGLPEVVSSENLGVLCEAGSPQSLAAAIVRAKQLGGREHAGLRRASAEKFCVKRMIENVSQLYESIWQGSC